jgi:hypothetical protein
MRFIDRFTRDDVSAKVWWPFTLLLLVALVLTFPGEHRAIDARHRATAATDAALGARVIAPLLANAPSGQITDDLSGQLTEEVRDEILVNDARIRAIRLWNTSHQVVWSSVASEQLDVANALNDADIDAAVAAAGAATWVTTDRSPGNAPSATRYYAYAAQGSQPLVAQFEYLDSELTSDVRFSWLGYQIILALGFLVSLAFALLSMREPEAKIGTGVPFYPESVPANMAVMDADRAIAIEQAAGRIKERVSGLQQRLDESEAARRRAEGDLQQALAALNTPGHRMPVPRRVIEPPAPAPEPVVIEPEPVAVAPEPEAAEPEPVIVEAPEPVIVEAPEPVIEEPVVAVPEPPAEPKPKPKPRARPKPKAEPAPPPRVLEPVLPPEPAVIAPAPEEPEPTIVPEPEPEPAIAASTEETTRPEVVVVPELQPAESAPPSGQETASQLLDRLVEPVGPHEGGDEASDLRARLARTAAIKKPGSKERRELDEQQHRP